MTNIKKQVLNLSQVCALLREGGVPATAERIHHRIVAAGTVPVEEYPHGRLKTRYYQQPEIDQWVQALIIAHRTAYSEPVPEIAPKISTMQVNVILGELAEIKAMIANLSVPKQHSLFNTSAEK